MANLTAAKLRRKARKFPQTADTFPDSVADSAPDERLPRHDSITSRGSRPLPRIYSMPAPLSGSSARLFIASLGNPPPLHTTRHSAGHIALRSLISYLDFPSLQRDPSYAGGAISVSPGVPTYTFYQSPTYMNTSGPTLLKAWRSFSSVHGLAANSGLIVLHDELELPLGQLKLKSGNSSAKGHNGIKSVQASLQGAGLMDRLGQNFVRIGVGIGRPVSREREDVSQFVLGQMTTGEKAKVEGAVNVLESLLVKEAERIGRG
jgi:peptidyl-tRNA hydrolase, PTH1 family